MPSWADPHTVGHVWGLQMAMGLGNDDTNKGTFEANALAALHAYDSKTNGLLCLLGVLPTVQCCAWDDSGAV